MNSIEYVKVSSSILLIFLLTFLGSLMIPMIASVLVSHYVLSKDV